MERLAREKIATQQRLEELKNELSQWMDVIEIDRILRQTVQPEEDQASTSTASGRWTDGIAGDLCSVLTVCQMVAGSRLSSPCMNIKSTFKSSLMVILSCKCSNYTTKTSLFRNAVFKSSHHTELHYLLVLQKVKT